MTLIAVDSAKFPHTRTARLKRRKKRRTPSWVGMPETLNDCDKLPHFLEVSERYKSVPSKTAENAVKGNPSILQKFMAIPKTAYCRYEWTHMLDVHDAWENEIMATHCDHPVVQDCETSSETPFMQPLR